MWLDEDGVVIPVGGLGELHLERDDGAVGPLDDEVDLPTTVLLSQVRHLGTRWRRPTQSVNALGRASSSDTSTRLTRRSDSASFCNPAEYPDREKSTILNGLASL